MLRAPDRRRAPTLTGVSARIGSLIGLATIGLAASGCQAVFVPKASGLGWTLNWASPVSYLVLALIVAVIVWRIVVRRKTNH